MTTVTLSRAVLAAALDSVRFAVGSEPELPMLAGVLVDAEAGGVTFVATDRYRMAIHREPATVDGPATRVIAPVSWVDRLRDHPGRAAGDGHVLAAACTGWATWSTALFAMGLGSPSRPTGGVHRPEHGLTGGPVAAVRTDPGSPHLGTGRSTGGWPPASRSSGRPPALLCRWTRARRRSRCPLRRVPFSLRTGTDRGSRRADAQKRWTLSVVACHAVARASSCRRAPGPASGRLRADPAAGDRPGGGLPAPLGGRR
jgi:hypothetical protein